MSLKFGTDGVRGLANAELTPELALGFGRAAARILGTGTAFAVGRDTRRSGPLLESAFVAGLTAEGVDALLLGVVPTPAVAWACVEAGIPGAVISASHNPFSDNGIKLFAAGGRKLADETETAIEEQIGVHAVDPPSGAAVGVPLASPAIVDRWLEGWRRRSEAAGSTGSGSSSTPPTAPRRRSRVASSPDSAPMSR